MGCTGGPPPDLLGRSFDEARSAIERTESVEQTTAFDHFRRAARARIQNGTLLNPIWPALSRPLPSVHPPLFVYYRGRAEIESGASCDADYGNGNR